MLCVGWQVSPTCVAGVFCLCSRVHCLQFCALLVFSSHFHPLFNSIWRLGIVFSKAQSSLYRGLRLGTIFFGTTIPCSRRYWICVAPSSYSTSPLTALYHFHVWFLTAITVYGHTTTFSPYSMRCYTLSHVITLWALAALLPPLGYRTYSALRFSSLQA